MHFHTLLLRYGMAFICFWGIKNQAVAQTEPDFLALTEPQKAAAIYASPKAETAAYYFRHFKKLSSVYEGYLIELVVSQTPLRRDYELFKYYGNVYYERLDNGKIAYYILGEDFSSKRSIRRFIKNVIRPRVPKARLVIRR